MKKTLLLFDIDGTLLTTRGAGTRAMNRVGSRLFGDGFNFNGIEMAGHLDPLIFAEAAEINGLTDVSVKHQLFHDQYIDELRDELERAKHDVRAMPGVHHVLNLLHRRSKQRGDVSLGLVTGNYSRAVPLKLQAIALPLDWFEVTAFGDEGRTRPDLVALAMSKYKLVNDEPCDPRKVIVIGDTVRDVRCAKAHACKAFAVCTGGDNRAALKAAGADAVVDDLSDPAPLLAMIV
jgi:phosphoglycolate phosphatase-like HAD superfamily hydrolase